MTNPYKRKAVYPRLYNSAQMWLCGTVCVIVALSIGLTVGLLTATWINKEGAKIEARLAEQRAYQGKPIKINDSEFTCTVLVAGAGDITPIRRAKQ